MHEGGTHTLEGKKGLRKEVNGELSSEVRSTLGSRKTERRRIYYTDHFDFSIRKKCSF